MQPPSQKVRAVFDTSFWTGAHRADVIADCFDLFELVVPRAVEGEIRSVQADQPRREYPYATLFRRLRSQMYDPPDDWPGPLQQFGAGEAEAIALARHLGLRLLINEHRGAQFALRLEIVVITVADVIVALRIREVISDRAARRKLSLIEPITTGAIIADALRALDAL
jgi:predicted nucleic acid-binding protein